MILEVPLGCNRQLLGLGTELLDALPDSSVRKVSHQVHQQKQVADLPLCLGGDAVCASGQASGVVVKSMSAVVTVPAVRPGALWYFQ